MNFEILIEKFRYIIYIPIITLLLTGLGIFLWTIRNYLFLTDIRNLSEKEIIIGFISSFDLFLLGILAIIFAVSLYELYIKEIDKNSKLPKALIISNLEELKGRVAKLIYLILLITLFKVALYFKIETSVDLFLFSLSILAVSLSIYFTSRRPN